MVSYSYDSYKIIFRDLFGFLYKDTNDNDTHIYNTLKKRMGSMGKDDLGKQGYGCGAGKRVCVALYPVGPTRTNTHLVRAMNAPFTCIYHPSKQKFF